MSRLFTPDEFPNDNFAAVNSYFDYIPSVLNGQLKASISDIVTYLFFGDCCLGEIELQSLEGVSAGK